MRNWYALEDSLTEQMGVLFIGRVLALCITLATPLVVVRVFSQADFGLYKQLFLLQSMLCMMLSLGLPWSLYYFLPREGARRGTFVSQTLVLLTIVGGLGVLGCVLLKRGVAIWLNSPELEPLIPLVGVVSGLVLSSTVLEIVMITAGQARLASATIACSELARGGLIVGTAVAIQSIFALAVGMVVFACMRIVALLLYLKREGLLGMREISPGPLRDQLGYALPFWLAALAEMAAAVLPQLYVSALYGPAVFAVFAVGCATVPFVPILFESVSDVALVRITEHARAGEMDAVASVLSDSIRKLALVCFPLSFLLAATAREFIVGLYTSRFEASVPLFMLFIVIFPLTALSLDYVPRAFADTGFLLKMYALRAVLTGTLLGLLTKPLGLIGAMVATILPLALSRGYTYLRIKQLTGVSLKRIVPWPILVKIIGCSGVATSMAVLVKVHLDLPALVVLFVSTAVFVAAYVPLVWGWGLVNEEERQLAGRYARHARKRVLGMRLADR